MHPIFYYILFYLLLGGVGMAVANRKVEKQISRQRWLKYFTYIGISGFVILCIFLRSFNNLGVAIVIIGFLELKKVNTASAIKKATFILSLLIYFTVGFGFWMFAEFFDRDWHLFIYFQVLSFDAFCQITGQLFGRRKLIAISPAKTWEGLLGGFIFCLISSSLAAGWIHATVFVSLVLGTLTAFTALSGDLLASYYKRKIGIKDYGDSLPGQGGLLDRFDSLMMTGMVYYFLTIIFRGYGQVGFFAQ
ncbi:MAG TPA: phosphatidate cytidylyltransferase [Chitinophagales bacterium]|nr:phosphatidate cytidylyltransferase [Chitinophagales bacterium]